MWSLPIRQLSKNSGTSFERPVQVENDTLILSTDANPSPGLSRVSVLSDLEGLVWLRLTVTPQDRHEDDEDGRCDHDSYTGYDDRCSAVLPEDGHSSCDDECAASPRTWYVSNVNSSLFRGS
jgi:hypothetical protein